MVLPILKVYADSTDGSYTEEKESALVWNYSNADPDFGRWQVGMRSLIQPVGGQDWTPASGNSTPACGSRRRSRF